MGSPTLLIAIGVLFLAGLALDAIGRRVHVPRVTLLILLGVIVGPPGFDILPPALSGADELYASVALTMVAFLLGGSLKRETLVAHGREILVLSIVVVVVSIVVVTGGLLLVGLPLSAALLLGAVSAATAPAATHDIVRQSGNTGRFATNLLGVVAIDDAWGLIAFSMALTAVAMLTDGGTAHALLVGLREAGGAILLGLAVGLPAAFLTGRIKPGEPTLVEALGLVFLVAGAALLLDVSFLLAGMVCGATVVNFARHHDRAFHEIERIEWPFLLLFFVMAGASLDVGALSSVGWVAVAYVFLRAFGRLAGGALGGAFAGVGAREGGLMGLALMPQAGVAIGMALVAVERVPSMGEMILAVTISSTIAFEIAGPLMTQAALKKAKTLENTEA